MTKIMNTERIRIFVRKTFTPYQYKRECKYNEIKDRLNSYDSPWTEDEIRELMKIPRFMLDGNTIYWFNAPYVYLKYQHQCTENALRKMRENENKIIKLND